MKPLNGKVALVTGATRGVGLGIAVGLGEAGATVYVTGRTLTSAPHSEGLSGSLQDTALAVEGAGGTCIPLQVDHSDDEQIRCLFEQIAAEQQGQLDLLVNNVFSGVSAISQASGRPFWECDPQLWDAVNRAGLRSHYLASVFAARLMVSRKKGLICTISSWGGLAYIFGVAYGTGKSACDRLAADMAVELKPHNVASLSIWPGIVGTEQITRLVAETKDNLSEKAGLQAFGDGYNWETPLLTGRAIAALAADAKIMDYTGRVAVVAELAERYNLVDKAGNRPASLRSLRFLLPSVWTALKNVPGLLPDLKIPWAILLLKLLQSPKFL
ncbi:MAG: SDR family NAD(P)-dependent oxidoreductase [Chloroflexaceae bacterium]|nr:SDR family NAD(P)-dependent oxidoreductase [Chloroflexaceae bacterium]